MHVRGTYKKKYKMYIKLFPIMLKILASWRAGERGCAVYSMQRKQVYGGYFSDCEKKSASHF